MAWTYSDWITQSTDADRVTRLRLHIGEVSAQIGPDMSSAAGSVSHGSLTAYLSWLQSQLATYERRAGSNSSGFTRGRCL